MIFCSEFFSLADKLFKEKEGDNMKFILSLSFLIFPLVTYGKLDLGHVTCSEGVTLYGSSWEEARMICSNKLKADCKKLSLEYMKKKGLKSGAEKLKNTKIWDDQEDLDYLHVEGKADCFFYPR